MDIRIPMCQTRVLIANRQGLLSTFSTIEEITEEVLPRYYINY